MAKATLKTKPSELDPSIEIFDCEQGSEDWARLRLGLVTASNFHKIIAEGEGKMRSRYMRDLAGELLTGAPAETYSNAAMERGKKAEADAADHYARTHFADLIRVGFVKNSRLLKYSAVGASPDYLIGSDGGLEIKTLLPALIIERLEKGAGMPPEHRAQVHGNMWVCEREWWDVKIYYPSSPGFPGMPDYTIRVFRDDSYIQEKLAKPIEIFNYELKILVQKIRGMGK